MTKKFPWFRLYANDLLGDRKIQRIHKQTGVSLAEIRGLWLTLLCLASESPDRGLLSFDGGIPFEYDELVEECGMDAMRFHEVFNHFINMQMFSFDESEGLYYLPNWEDRQPKSDTTGSKRVRKHRAKMKDKDVTLQKRYCNALEEEEESEEEKEKEPEREQEQQEDSAVVFSYFQNEICMLTPGLAERVGSWLDHYPRDWILKAIDVAVSRSKRRADYIEGILKN